MTYYSFSNRINSIEQILIQSTKLTNRALELVKLIITSVIEN